MDLLKRFRELWVRTPSGILIPEGLVSDSSLKSKETYLQLKDRAIAIQGLYEASGVPLAPNSDLGKLIQDAKSLSDAWMANQKVSYQLLFRAALINRIADAVLPLQDVAMRETYLKEFTSAGMDLFTRQQSKAKGVFWEVELWSSLRRRSVLATLCDPPDIIIEVDGQTIAVPCKKVYSEKNVEKTLSEAVGQIEEAHDYGIVAMNLDDLLPANGILRKPSEDAAASELDRWNQHFIHRHERHFRKYLDTGRILAAFVSTGVLTDLTNDSTRIYNFRQSTVWVVPNLPAEKLSLIRRFRDAYLG